jgi:serine/threonine-protein kinase OSR1/STK39
MEMTSHSNLAQFHTCFIDGEHVWIVMPVFEGGSIDTILATSFPNGIQDETIILAILHEVLKGLNYLHKQKLIHRDIKSSNIVIDKNGNICLNDFGISLFSHDQTTATFAGTLQWMAPETIGEKHILSSKSDIWAVGITAIEIAEGKVPFSELRGENVIIACLIIAY